MSPQPKNPAEDEGPDEMQAEAEAVELYEETTTPGKPASEASGGEAGGERSETETAAETTGVDRSAGEAGRGGERSETDGAEADAVTEPEDPAAAPATQTASPSGTGSPQPAARRRDRPREPAEAVVVRAQARYVRSSARKARLVCDNIRGKSVADARAILAFSPRNIAQAWTKLLESAVANAENNHDLDGDDLKILAVYADEGPTIKRFRPRAMGRATQIRKRTSHLSIQLTTEGQK